MRAQQERFQRVTVGREREGGREMEREERERDREIERGRDGERYL